jgi:hypothetical protein
MEIMKSPTPCVERESGANVKRPTQAQSPSKQAVSYGTTAWSARLPIEVSFANEGVGWKVSR